MKIQIESTPQGEIRNVRRSVDAQSRNAKKYDGRESVKTFERMKRKSGEDCRLVELMMCCVNRVEMTAMKAVVFEVGESIGGESDGEHLDDEESDRSERHGFLNRVNERRRFSLVNELEWPSHELRHDEERAGHSLDFLPVKFLIRRIIGKFL